MHNRFKNWSFVHGDRQIFQNVMNTKSYAGLFLRSLAFCSKTISPSLCSVIDIWSNCHLKHHFHHIYNMLSSSLGACCTFLESASELSYARTCKNFAFVEVYIWSQRRSKPDNCYRPNSSRLPYLVVRYHVIQLVCSSRSVCTTLGYRTERNSPAPTRRVNYFSTTLTRCSVLSCYSDKMKAREGCLLRGEILSLIHRLLDSTTYQNAR